MDSMGPHVPRDAHAPRRSAGPAIFVASALPSCRLVLLFAGAVVLADSAFAGVALIAAALLSVPLGVVLGVVIDRASFGHPSSPPASPPASRRDGQPGESDLAQVPLEARRG
jgi:hypothetical protein